MNLIRRLITIAAAAAAIATAAAFSPPAPKKDKPVDPTTQPLKVPPARERTYRSFFLEIDPATGDTLVVYRLKPLTVRQ